MALNRVTIQNVRNIRSAELQALGRSNVFFGHNGSGKTSVLESIHLLGMARSFRGSSVKSLITHGEPHCTVFGSASQSAAGGAPGSTLALGVERHRTGEASIRVRGDSVRTVAELAENLPLQVISADSFELLTGPPHGRRQFVDWGVFHVEHGFYARWQRFQRCIKQRNSLLRRGKLDARELGVWSRDLALAGEELNALREGYFEALLPVFLATAETLAPNLKGLHLKFRRGWERGLTYAEALDNGLKSDLEQGYTHTGPQRADVRVTIGGHLAAETLSRGQQKLVVCALKLAQGTLMARDRTGECTFLIDDLPSELDRAHSERVCGLLSEIQSQVFMTCVARNDIADVWPGLDSLTMFHVEHGAVNSI